MGQYYKPVILAENKKTVVKFLTSWSHNQGAKLMEHSYVGNDFVGLFESLIANNPQPVVWAGDYAEPEIGFKNNTYTRCIDKLEVKPETKITTKHRYIVNHTKGIFVDKTKVPFKKDDWPIHPLPLLTCEGNGEGGGDFYGNDPNKLIGSWARDVISVETKVPKGFKELFFNLVE